MTEPSPLIPAPEPEMPPSRRPDAAMLRWDVSPLADRARMLRAIGAEDLSPSATRVGWTALPPLQRALIRIAVSGGSGDELKREDRYAVAELIGCHPLYVWQCCSGKKDMDAVQASRVERITGIRRWWLRQGDWWEVWPELIDAPGAPEPKDAPLPRLGRELLPALQPQLESAAA